ncbi:MAG: MBL fold metallo-hydrolase [Tyzzerella sp.]|nr:MBL fold metallo-hydrolase [Tyzzerella sp.]
MKIEKFVLGSMVTNCYLLINEETKELVIIDPATCPDYVVSHVKSNGYIPRAIFLTHAHFDHVMGIDGWVKEFGIPVYLHEDEKKILEDPELNLSGVFGASYSYSDVKCLRDGQELEVAGFVFKVIHTPGHTCGGCCYYCEAEDILISGDTLFYQSVGRSDFPTGSMGTLVRSIKEKLFCLPEDVMVYPGHNDATCIADEKKYNPFV